MMVFGFFGSSGSTAVVSSVSDIIYEKSIITMTTPAQYWKLDGRTAEELADEYENRILRNADIWKDR